MQYGNRIFCAVLALCLSLKSGAQVNLTSGAAEYSIPLYNYSDANKRLGTGISLEYVSGNGLKANEIPSAVGAGWQLQCGGVIERIQHGLPDDQKRYTEIAYTDIGAINYFPNANFVDNYYPNGYLYSEFSPANPVNNGGGYTPLFEWPTTKYAQMPEYTADYEQDVFSFTFNGRAGFFIISKPDVNGNSEIRTLVDSKLKIRAIHGDLNNTNNIKTTISEFWVTDETGIKYVFRDAELIQECVYDAGATYNLDGSLYSNTPFPIYLPGHTQSPDNLLRVMRASTRNAFVKSKWYLSEIVNSMTGQKIVFEYENYQMDMQGAITSHAEKMDTREEFWVVQERLVGTWKRLKRIKFSSLEIAEFTYSALPREDVPMDKALQTIDIQYNGQSKFRWEFETGYFVKNIIQPSYHIFTPTDKAWARLCLTKLQRVGADGTVEPPYEFNYWLEQESSLLANVVPPLFTFYQDFWGYFNPRNKGWYDPLSGSFGASTPYTAVAGSMMPKSLYYDYTPFSQGTSVFRRSPSVEAQNGLLRSVRNPLGGKLEYEYELNYFNVNANYAGMGGMRVKQTSMNNGLDNVPINIKEYKYVKEDGVTTSSWGGTDPRVFQTNPSTKVYRKCGNREFPGIPIANAAMAFQRTLNWTGSIGLSIKSALPFVLDIILQGIIANYLSDLMGPSSTTYPTISRSSVMLNAHNPIPYQYARVEVVDRLGAGNIGKTVFEFTSPNEPNPLFAIDVPTLLTPYSSRQRFAYWFYGLPTKTTVYDKDNNIVLKTENEYNPVKYTLTDSRHLSQSWLPSTRTYDCSGFPSNVPGTNEIDHDTYSPICGRIERTSEKKYVYNSNHEFRLSTTNFGYSPLNYMLNNESTTNSKGEVVEKRTYYATDYSGTFEFHHQKMKDSNMVAIPISTQTIITKSNGQQYLINGEVDQFITISDGDVKAIRSYETRIVNPVPLSSVTFVPTQMLPNATYYQEVRNTITSPGNPYYEQTNTQVPSNAIHRITNIFDYQNKFITSTTVNGSQADIAYTSFEAEGTGGWTYDQAKVIQDWAPTGKKYLNAPTYDPTTISRTIKNNKTYTLSFWVKGFMVPFLSGGTFTQKVAYINPITRWTYYEFEVTNGGLLTISNTDGGTGWRVINGIDEIRIHYAESRMNTTTYDPVFGKTSECDENGRITYYEYDGLGRLKLIRDGNRNVIKTYEYNYKQ